MVRRIKYATIQERDAARREQTRLHVATWRARKRASKQRDENSNIQQAGDHEQKAKNASVALPSEADAAVNLSREIDRHTASSPMNLSFGTMTAIVEGLSSICTEWPWWQSLSSSMSNPHGIQLVDIAVFAIGCHTIGKLRANENLVQLSLLAYHNVLHLLHLRLSKAGDTLLPGPELNTIQLSCSGIEVIENAYNPIGRQQWLENYRCCLKTFELAGPAAYSTEYGLEVLRAMKAKIVFLAVFDRERTFLDIDAWRTVPFQGRARTDEDKLWLLLERLPAYLERADILTAQDMTCDVSFETELLWQDITTLKQDLLGWKLSLCKSHDIQEILVAPSTTKLLGDRPELSTVHPHRYIFPSVTFAELITMYWHYEMRLLALCLQVQPILENSAFFSKPTNDSQVVWESDLEAPANNICRSMEYLKSIDTGHSRLFCYPATFALRMAMWYYCCQPDKQAEAEWCQVVAEKVYGIDLRSLIVEPYFDMNQTAGCE